MQARHQLQAYYRLHVPPSMSIDDGLIELKSRMCDAIAGLPMYGSRPRVSARWQGQEFAGRDLIFYNEADKSPYAVLEFDEAERTFFVQDSSRTTLVRECICGILDAQELVRREHGEWPIPARAQPPQQSSRSRA